MFSKNQNSPSTYLKNELPFVANSNCSNRSVEWLDNNINKFKNLSIRHFNTRSLSKSKNLTEELLASMTSHPDLIMLTEPFAANSNCSNRSVEWLDNNINKFKNLSIRHFNTRSLSKSKNLTEELLASMTSHPDLIALTETKLNLNNVNLAQLNNYTLLYSDSMTNAGGVVFILLMEYNIVKNKCIEKFHS